MHIIMVYGYGMIFTLHNMPRVKVVYKFLLPLHLNLRMPICGWAIDSYTLFLEFSQAPFQAIKLHGGR